MLDCVINWRAMMSGEEQIAAAFGRRHFSFPTTTIKRGDSTANHLLLAQIGHERRGANGIAIRMVTDILLSNGGASVDLHGNTRIAVSQVVGKKSNSTWVQLGCTLPDMTWTYEEEIPARGVSRSMRQLKALVDAEFAQLAERRGRGGGGIVRNLSTVGARRLLDAIVVWATAPGMKWSGA